MNGSSQRVTGADVVRCPRDASRRHMKNLEGAAS
jgi:hypothetical protein